MNLPAPVSRIVYATLLLVSCIVNAGAETRDPYKFFFNESWNDFKEELNIARTEGKHGILFFFELDECPFCHRMKQTVLNQSDVQKYFRENFRCIDVDIEGDVEVVDFNGETTTQKDFAFKSNRVRATPVFAFYDLEGNRIVRFTGATNNKEEFMWLGEYVLTGSYKDMNFTKYKTMKQAEKK